MKLIQSAAFLAECQSVTIRRLSRRSILACMGTSERGIWGETTVEGEGDLALYHSQDGRIERERGENTLVSQISNLHNSIKTFPQQSSVKHHHHFDLQSRGFIISAAISLIVSAISVGIAVTNSRENNRLQSSDVRFRMIRQVNPQIVAWTDSVYYKNPERAEQETIKLEAHEMVLKDAEALLKQKQEETKNAQSILKKLKKD